MVMSKVMDAVIGLVMLLVAVVVLMNVGPSLLGSAVTSASTGYISNATGCFIDSPSPTADVAVNSVYCSTFTVFPIIMVIVFIVMVLGVVFAVLKKHAKI